MASLALDFKAALAVGDLWQAQLVVDGMACLVSPTPHLDIPLRCETRVKMG